MTQKRYTQENNAYSEDPKGACAGIEWTDSNGNVRRVICVDFPDFSASLRIVRVLYVLQVKPVGYANFLNERTIDRTISDTSNLRYCNPALPSFGTLAEEEGENVCSEVQFFIDNVKFNIHQLPLSIAHFEYQTIEKIIEELNG